ncbi:MAG: hypothetical protein ABW185_00640 [Sedimenticola sp.]
MLSEKERERERERNVGLAREAICIHVVHYKFKCILTPLGMTPSISRNSTLPGPLLKSASNSGGDQLANEQPAFPVE